MQFNHNYEKKRKKSLSYITNHRIKMQVLFNL